jgi:hypothetical protein
MEAAINSAVRARVAQRSVRVIWDLPVSGKLGVRTIERRQGDSASRAQARVQIWGTAIQIFFARTNRIDRAYN